MSQSTSQGKAAKKHAGGNRAAQAKKKTQSETPPQFKLSAGGEGEGIGEALQFAMGGATAQFAPVAQFAPPKKDKTKKKATSAGLAWEIFKPVLVGGAKKLIPGLAKTTKTGQHYKHVIDIATKLDSTNSTLKKYQKKIESIKKPNGAAQEKFNLKSIGNVYAHVKSIPEAWEIRGEDLINEAAQIVTQDMFSKNIQTNIIPRLNSFAEIVKQSKKLHPGYHKMIAKLSDMEKTTKASSDALWILETHLMDLVKVPIPSYQAWAFGMAQTVKGYRSDVQKVHSEIKRKRKGYQDSIKATKAMEAYMNGTTGRKALESRYRQPKSKKCVERLKNAAWYLPGDDHDFYHDLLAHHHYDEVVDAMDWLDLTDGTTYSNVISKMIEAYPNKATHLKDKEKRFYLGQKFTQKLDVLRPTLNKLAASKKILALDFVFQEYYHFWRDDSRPVLSNTMFTYRWQIDNQIKKVDKLPFYLGSISYFTP